MPISPLIIIGGIGALAFLLKKGEKKSWKEDEYSDITEFRATPQGEARYFKAEFVPSIAAALAQYSIGKTATTDVGGRPLTVFNLVPNPNAGPNSAFATCVAAYQSGLAVYVTLTVWDSKQKSVSMMTSAPIVRAEFAKAGSPWAIIADPQYPLPSAQPSVTQPGSIPAVPGMVPGSTPAPSQSGTPITLPGGISVTMPPGIIIPGVTAPQGQTPPAPPQTPQVPQTPTSPNLGDCIRSLDAHMPDVEKQLTCNHLTNPSATIESLVLGGEACKVRGYPLAAEAYFAAARAKGWTGQQTGPTIPAISGDWPFRIRPGDIPYMLASYYTGDSSRVKEILAVNPGMTTKNVNGTTYYTPWVVNSIIQLPASWPVGTKMLPNPTSTNASSIPYVRPA